MFLFLLLLLLLLLLLISSFHYVFRPLCAPELNDTMKYNFVKRFWHPEHPVISRETRASLGRHQRQAFPSSLCNSAAAEMKAVKR